MQEYAVQEWYDYYEPKEGIKKTRMSSILDCFCKGESKRIGKVKLAN